MSFAIHFLDQARAATAQPLGDREAETDQPGAPEHPLTADEIALWERIRPGLLAAMPPGAEEIERTAFAREALHEPSGMLVSFGHDDYQLSIPYWTSNATPEMFASLAAVTSYLEEQTGRVGIDEISEGRFIDAGEDTLGSFAAVSEGFAEFVQGQSLFGWLRSKLRRG